MTKIITVTNQKGGVAKTTTAHAVGAALIHKGRKVLFVDLDPQANLTLALGTVSHNPLCSSFGVLSGEAAVHDAIIHTGKADLLSGVPALASLARTLDTAENKEIRLKEVLEKITERYDYIVIDTPPSLSILTVNALSAADEVIIPAQADEFSLRGIKDLYSTISAIKKYVNPALKISGILLTRHNIRSILAQDITSNLGAAARHIGTKLFETCIRECTALREAQSKKEDIFTYAPACNAARDYENFMKELNYA